MSRDLAVLPQYGCRKPSFDIPLRYTPLSASASPKTTAELGGLTTLPTLKSPTIFH